MTINDLTMNPAHEETEHTLPDSNTLGGTTSTGAGPDGQNDPTAPADRPQPETLGLGHDDLDEADDVARRNDERNKAK